MGNRMATIDIGRKLGGCVPFGRGELGSNVTQCGLGRGLASYQVASWSIQLFGHNRHGPKFGGLCPLECGAGSTSNTIAPQIQYVCWHCAHYKCLYYYIIITMLPGPRPTIVPSGILIHPAVWPQQTWTENWGAVASSTMHSGPRPTSIPSGHNRHGLKIA